MMLKKRMRGAQLALFLSLSLSLQPHIFFSERALIEMRVNEGVR